MFERFDLRRSISSRKKVNETFEKVRRLEFKKAKETDDQISRSSKPIHTAMLLVECFHKALDKKTIKGFRETSATWYRGVRESKLEPFPKFAKTIRKYRRNIEAYIGSRLMTAVAKELNNKIKVLRQMGYGYTNPVSYCRKVLQRCG